MNRIVCFFADMKITIAAVGRIREKYISEGIREYAKRLSAYCRLEFIEVQDEKAPENLSPAEADIVKKKEGERLLNRLPRDAFVIALDIGGVMTDSSGFAEKISSITVRGASSIVFVIGGSLGLHEEILRRADFRLSFSRLTFPHQLMRLILLEQIYRSFRIINNEPYHK